MVTYTDDETVTDETLLLRRIPAKPNLNIVWDGNTNCWRPSSASFEDHPNGSPMSIVLSDTLGARDRPLESVLDGHGEGFALAAFTAGVARECEQKVVRDPVEDEPAHGVIVGDKPKRIRRKLAKCSHWIVVPEV